jgi:hypothetical protein
MPCELFSLPLSLYDQEYTRWVWFGEGAMVNADKQGV